MMTPSLYMLPQKCSADFRRAREATLSWEQGRLAFLSDDGSGEDFARPYRLLPGAAAKMPKDKEFPPAKKAGLVASKLRALANSKLTMFVERKHQDPMVFHQSLYRLMSPPSATMTRWRRDREFARQRLGGVNPMVIGRARELPARDVCAAADRWLASQGHLSTTQDLYRDRRLYLCDYPELASPRVQKSVSVHAHLTAPSAWFFLDEAGGLLPLAIQLHPVAPSALDPVLTPDMGANWLVARAHVQSADAHAHEGFYHLLETHLVNEAIAVAMWRRLHPHHPIRLLLDPHFEDTLAINFTARGNLLSPAGPIQASMAAGVQGTLDAARMRFHDWSWSGRTLREDLSTRDVWDLPNYHYREDAVRWEAALRTLVQGTLSPWYVTDEDVRQDVELAAFLDEVGHPDAGAIPGFPCAVDIDDRTKLFELVAQIVFRAGPQHAAVNNGQFDTYGYVPNSPGRFSVSPLVLNASLDESVFWAGLPPRDVALKQMGMTWVLSTPTERSFLEHEFSPAFGPKVSLEAANAVDAFRRALDNLTRSIEARNATLEVPYVYLSPRHASPSTDR